jgi:hypothetical protein
MAYGCLLAASMRGFRARWASLSFSIPSNSFANSGSQRFIKAGSSANITYIVVTAASMTEVVRPICKDTATSARSSTEYSARQRLCLQHSTVGAPTQQAAVEKSSDSCNKHRSGEVVQNEGNNQDRSVEESDQHSCCQHDYSFVPQGHRTEVLR